MRARLASSLILVFALALPALAQDRRGAPSLDRVLPHVRQTVPGRFYDAEGPFFGPNGRATYRIKWMTPDNRIIWFSVDAQSGQIVGGTPMGPPPPRFRDDAPRRNNWQDNGGGGQGGWGSQGGNPGGNQGNQGGGWGGRGGQGGGQAGGGQGGSGQGGGHGSGDRGGNRGGGRHRPNGG